MQKITHTLDVIATGNAAPYGIGEHVETIRGATKKQILAALKSGHIVRDPKTGTRFGRDEDWNVVEYAETW